MKRALSLCLSLLLLLCGGLVCAADDEPHTHVFGEWYTVTEPTCTDEGEERRDCESCDAFETRPIDPRHKFGEWYTFIEPSCTDEGEERRDCEGCDAFETRVVPALYHSFVIDPAVPATCTTAGKTQGEHCELCGAVKTKQVTLKPLGHAVLDENGNCRLCGEHIKDLCPYCHRDHSGELFGSLTAWLHRLFYSVRLFFTGD